MASDTIRKSPLILRPEPLLRGFPAMSEIKYQRILHGHIAVTAKNGIIGEYTSIQSHENVACGIELRIYEPDRIRLV